MTDFKREERYTVIKNKTGKQVECVVVEKDWPEYEIVWQMMQDRVEGRPNIVERITQDDVLRGVILDTLEKTENELTIEQKRVKALTDALQRIANSNIGNTWPADVAKTALATMKGE